MPITISMSVQAVLSALTSFQFIVIPIASYVLLGEEFTFTALVCIIVVLLGASCEPQVVHLGQADVMHRCYPGYVQLLLQGCGGEPCV